MKHSALASLFPHLWPDVGRCPFVVDQDAAKQVSLRHYDAGQDATYVTVARRLDENLSQHNDSLSDMVTIGYAPFVEGTTIIYDAIEETLQGKAGQFPCNIIQQSFRMYPLLPFQIVATALQA